MVLAAASLTMSFPVPHVIRDAVDSDVPFVIHAWVEEMRDSPSRWGMPNVDYYSWQRAYIRQQLRESKTLIACAPDDPNHLFGYVTFAPPNYVHWLYVKSAYRNIGFARALVHAALGAPPRIYVTQLSDGTLKHIRAHRDKSRVVYIAPQYVTHSRQETVQ